jgi:cell division protein FtsQ
VRTVLTGAARDMTTLHVQADDLEDSVRGFGVVHALEVRTDFPNHLRIHVVERRAAAVMLAGGRRIPVAADGTVLTGLPVEGRLPVVKGRVPGDAKRIDDARALTALRVIGAAPDLLGRRILRVERHSGKGYVAKIRRGPDVILGSLDQLRAKWLAAASVLADPASRGATYVDVRLPDRPAAGGLGEETVAPAGAEELQQAAAAAAAAATPAQPGAETPPAQAQPAEPQQAVPDQAAPQSTAPEQAPQQAPATPQPAPGTAEGGAAPGP